MRPPVLAGLDIGGTKIGLSVGGPDGEVFAADRLVTDPARDPADLLAEARAGIDALCAASGLERPSALGVAAPGPLSYREGRLLAVPNMPRWQHFPLQAWLDDHAGCAATFMNDANASVLAEALWGAARGASSAIFLTMSTGMGAGLWLDGRVYEGPSALAGEVGHLRLSEDGPVGFGKRGSVEGYCSGPGIVQVAEAERLRCVQAGVATALVGAGPLDPRRVCELARQGDRGALAVVERCGTALGRLCALLVDLLNPEVIVLGTIGSAFFDLFEPLARAGITAEALPAAAAEVAIRPTGLVDRGNQTALAVAARLLDADRA
jgi:glucokinase